MVGGRLATSNAAATGSFDASFTASGMVSRSGDENVTVPLTAAERVGGQRRGESSASRENCVKRTNNATRRQFAVIGVVVGSWDGGDCGLDKFSPGGWRASSSEGNGLAAGECIGGRYRYED